MEIEMNGETEDEVPEIATNTSTTDTTLHEVATNQVVDIRNRRQQLTDARHEYGGSLTIHGLSRVITGKRWEIGLWCVAVLAGIIGTVYLSQDLIEDYAEYKYNTDIRIHEEEKIDMPTVTICNANDLQMSMIKVESTKGSHQPHLVKLANGSNPKCTSDGEGCPDIQNGTFGIEVRKNPNPNISFPVGEKGPCMTIHGPWAATITGSNGLEILIHNPGDGDQGKSTRRAYIVYINQRSEEFFQAEEDNAFEVANGLNQVKLTATRISRLGEPYFKCKKDIDSNGSNIFGGFYTVSKCKRSCLVKGFNATMGSALPFLYKEILRVNVSSATNEYTETWHEEEMGQMQEEERSKKNEVKSSGSRQRRNLDELEGWEWDEEDEKLDTLDTLEGWEKKVEELGKIMNNTLEGWEKKVEELGKITNKEQQFEKDLAQPGAAVYREDIKKVNIYYDKAFEAASECMTNCPPPCNQLHYALHHRYSQLPENRGRVIVLSLKISPSTLKEYAQKPAATLVALLSNFGGMLGLMVGCSILSLLELVVYASLILLEKCHR